ncbi:hypothetical protein KR026_008842, partial [Drosophila bipectinata]
MQILVVTRDGRKSIYEADRFGTVGNLKTRIGRNMSVPMGFSRLVYKGRILSNQSVLEDAGVKRMSTLELFWQPLVFTPKQFREKEGDMDKLELKQRGTGSNITESYDQMLKTGGAVKASGSFAGGQSMGGDVPNPSCSGSAKFALPAVIRSSSKLQEIDEEELEDLTSLSSDELEFLAAYRRPKAKDEMKPQDELLDREKELPFKDLGLASTVFPLADAKGVEVKEE